jgi:hypothetical protein
MAVALFLPALAVLTHSAQNHLPFNLCSFIPGNWTLGIAVIRALAKM